MLGPLLLSGGCIQWGYIVAGAKWLRSIYLCQKWPQNAHLPM